LASEAWTVIGHSELRTRLVSGAVLGLLVLGAELAGGSLFALLIAAMAAAGFWEWTAMTGGRDPAWARIAALACLASGLMALSFEWTGLAGALIALPVVVTLIAGFRRDTFRWLGLGLAYVALPSAALIALREAEPFGWAAVLFVFLVVWATDIAAYFGGRYFGGPKLWPAVSPNKTWSGAASGLAAAIAAGGLMAWAAGVPRAGTCFVLAGVLSVASQAGDLFESGMKRRFEVKDSGRLIPGHGGVLDRVDGLLAAAAAAWVLAALGLGGALLALPRAALAEGLAP
jgi:phosphatidate cytidylyltransferase